MKTRAAVAFEAKKPLEIVEVDLERADFWIGNGAQPSDPVKKLISIVRARG
jgi:ribosomal protein S16